MKKFLILSAAATMLMACGSKIPEQFSESDDLPNIYPDYTNVTVPINIAPLTFEMDGKVEDMVTKLTAGNEEVICGGDKVQPNADD